MNLIHSRVLDLTAAEIISQETTDPIEPEVVYEVTDASGTRVSARAFLEGNSISVKQFAKVSKSNGIFLAAQTGHNYAVIAERDFADRRY